MLTKIVNRNTPDGKEFFEWWLWDGPEGVEEVHGYATDMITAFSKILEWRERIATEYAQDLTAEQNFSTDNETD